MDESRFRTLQHYTQYKVNVCSLFCCSFLSDISPVQDHISCCQICCWSPKVIGWLNICLFKLLRAKRLKYFSSIICIASGGCCFKPETSKDGLKLFEIETVLSLEMRKPKKKADPSSITKVSVYSSVWSVLSRHYQSLNQASTPHCNDMLVQFYFIFFRVLW